ncbi:MAG: DUF2231 domain-containing protein [Pyrinomonadaceae bacterium]
MMKRPIERGGPVTNLRQALSLVKMGAPMHPIFVHFTIALTSTSLIFDALGFLFNKPSLTAAGAWTLVVATAMTLMTISTGLTSASRAPIEEGEARSFLRAHMALGLIFYGLLLAMTWWRLWLWQAERRVSWVYLALFTVLTIVMTVQGYLGGELVYRYGVEVEQTYRTLPEQNAHSPAPTITPSRSKEIYSTEKTHGEAA